MVYLGDSTGCGQVSYIDFGVPKVLASGQTGGSETDLWVSLNCTPPHQGVELIAQQGAAVSTAGVDNPAGCLSAINDDPIGSSATINLGSAVCVQTASGMLSYFKWARDSGGNAQLVVDAWRPVS